MGRQPNNCGRQIELRDGRRLGYGEYGDPQGRPVLYCHGFPSSRLEAGLITDAARRHGLRLIAVDRPGYGLSDFQPGRKLLDWPDDVVQLTAALGIKRCAVLGVSGGGPYALACAWKIPQRISSVATVGGLGPVYQPELLQAMRRHARLAFTLAQRSYPLLWLLYGGPMAWTIAALPQLALWWEEVAAAPADRQVLRRGEVRRCLTATVWESLRQGSRGVLWDAVLYARPWGFTLEDIAIPVELWHGWADRIVPPCHTQTIAEALPHGRVTWLPEAGHFSLPVDHCDAILGRIAAGDGRGH